jgi:membrane protease YdiL (CAAX protease family)
MKTLIKRHPVTAYFAMAFGWTWSIVLVMLLSGLDVNTPTPMFVIGGLVCNISPSIAAFIVTGITQGREGTKGLKEGFRKKVSVQWILLALLTVPSITALTALISSQTIRHYEIQLTVPMLALGLIWPLFSGFGEEFGWRGFLLPRLIAKRGLLKAGILLGVIWEIWHIPMHYMAYRNYGAYMIPAFAVIGFINLTLQTVIMTYIFTRSNGSIKLMILYHYTITASSIILGAFFKMETTPQLTVYEGIISVILFFVFSVILYTAKKVQINHIEEEKVC